MSLLANAILDHDKIVAAFIVAAIMFVIAAVLTVMKTPPITALLFVCLGLLSLTIGFLYGT